MSRTFGVCVPATDMVDTWFMHDLYRAGVHHAFAYPDDDQRLVIHESALIAESRNKLCKTALDEGCDWIIMVDTDMRLPQNAFSRLMDHDEPVVAANCAKRRRPVSMTARKEDPEDRSKLNAIWPDEEKQGLERCAVVGSAVMAIRADVFMQLPYPWFNTPWDEEGQRFVGEDLFFCAQLRSHDIPLYIDHGLSWGVGHIGQYVFRPNDAIAERAVAASGGWDHIKPEAEGVNGRELLVVK